MRVTMVGDGPLGGYWCGRIRGESEQRELRVGDVVVGEAGAWLRRQFPEDFVDLDERPAGRYRRRDMRAER